MFTKELRRIRKNEFDFLSALSALQLRKFLYAIVFPDELRTTPWTYGASFGLWGFALSPLQVAAHSLIMCTPYSLYKLVPILGNKTMESYLQLCGRKTSKG